MKPSPAHIWRRGFTGAALEMSHTPELEAHHPVTPAAPPPPKRFSGKQVYTAAREAGRVARAMGKPISLNPHANNGLAQAWKEGWLEETAS